MNKELITKAKEALSIYDNAYGAEILIESDCDEAAITCAELLRETVHALELNTNEPVLKESQKHADELREISEKSFRHGRIFGGSDG
jgi:hypothetical protein